MGGAISGAGPRSLRPTSGKKAYVQLTGVASTVLVVATMVLSAGLDMRAASSYSGTGSDDTFVGTPEPDQVSLRGGRDRASGAGAADRLSGGRGQDELLGGGGADTLLGGGGADQAWPGPGADTVLLGAGNDEVTLEPDGATDTLDCGPGHDIVVWLEASDASDVLVGCEDILLWTSYE